MTWSNRVKHTLFAATLGSLLASVALTAPAWSQSVNVALDANPDRATAGTFRWADTFLKALADKGWETESFPKDTIGGEDERLDQVRTGIIDVSMQNFSKATEFAPEMQVLQLPYSFQDPAHQKRFFTQSGFLDEVNAELAADDLMILSVVPQGNFLGIFNNKHPVHSVADMKGLRMRALDANQLEMFGQMGASGVVIPFSEVPNALQTGVADGYINAAGVPLTFGQAELFSDFTDAKVIISARLALASRQWWDGLSEDEKAQVKEAVGAANDDVYAWLPEVDGSQKEAIAKAGITVYEPTREELASFAEATRDMVKTIKDVPPEKIQAIQAEIARFAE